MTGIVVDGRGGLPLAGQTVAAGKQRATTDAEGRFTLHGLGPVYDLVVINGQRSRVTVYRGLSRRDPRIVHAVERDLERSEHDAEVAGVLVGGGEYPVTNAMHVHVRGLLARADVMLGGPSAPNTRGPAFGPMRLAWDGVATFSGELISLRQQEDPARAYCARARLELDDKAKQSVQLAFQAVPLVRRAPVEVSYPPSGITKPQVYADYRLPGTDAVLHAAAATLAEYDVADLASCGATLCTTAFIHNPYLRSMALACAPVSKNAVVLKLGEAPKFSRPAVGTPARVGLEYAWSAITGAVYRLALSPSEPTASAPAIRIVTRDISAAWPDLAELGVEFSEPSRAYAASVSAHGPYESVDDAAGPEGLAFGTPGEAWSREAELTEPEPPFPGPSD